MADPTAKTAARSSSPSLGDSAKVVDIENVEHAKTSSPHDDNNNNPDQDHVQGRALQPPAWIAALGPGERISLEKKLKRKIDLRLMPAIILMYILNYIDRYVNILIMTCRLGEIISLNSHELGAKQKRRNGSTATHTYVKKPEITSPPLNSPTSSTTSISPLSSTKPPSASSSWATS